MTPLADLLLRRIAQSGPITLAEYMAECLLHPEHGYYTRGDVFGRAGDFTTAPEISQMFGELVGLALAQAWRDQGAPAPFTLAEPGPGRGTLMADVLRVGAKVPGFSAAAQVHLIEASPALRQRQAETLAGVEVTWRESLSDLPEAPLFLVANEFFDALPIRQFEARTEGWAETVVGHAEGRLVLARAPSAPIAALAHRRDKPGQVVEICPGAAAQMTEIARRIGAHGGAALVFDYGDWGGTGDTFQALRHHQAVDPLEAPGEADLTAHVDFEALARTAQAAGAQVSRMSAQGAFLRALGIDQRAEALARHLPEGPRRENHLAAHRRLTDPAEMGSLFKVIGCVPPGAPLPAGLDP